MSRKTIPIRVRSDELTAILEDFDQIQVLRSTDGRDGTYDEISTAQTRPRLKSTKSVYRFVDPTWEATYYYVTAYYNSKSGESSEQSEPMLVKDDDALRILSAEELRTHYLPGITLVDKNGNPIEDDTLEWHIRIACSKLEHALDIAVRRKVIANERQDFDRFEYQKFIRIQLDVFPIITVESVSMILPNEASETVYPVEWRYIDKESALINIIPGANQPIPGSGFLWLPAMTGLVNSLRDVFKIDYTAGFENGAVPEALIDVLAKLAAISVLAFAGEFVLAPGIAAQSLRLDDLSTETKTTKGVGETAYGGLIKLYANQLKEEIPALRRYYKGIRAILA